MTVTIIGAGLAGVEAAYALSRCGIKSRLYEMKPLRFSPAHSHSGFAELVCSNSLKSDNTATAGGLLKAEMRLLGSLTLEVAEQTRVPAGGALAVDRTAFSNEITRRISSDPNIEVVTGEEMTDFTERDAIIATGPLTSDAFAEAISRRCGGFLSFYDAAAPIVTLDSIDMSVAFSANRYNKGDDVASIEDSRFAQPSARNEWLTACGSYINCPFTKDEYDEFYNALVNAETAQLHNFDQPVKYYEGCMPVEVLAKRGYDSLRFGCMKPVGLHDPRSDKRPYAVVQLRKENSAGSMYNLVGFQTNLKFSEQKRVFSLIPGLANAEFVRYGVMHRNTFIDSPRLLTRQFMLRGSDNVYFAGQITGVEGYMESAASGIVAGLSMAGRLAALPDTSMIGSLTRYISDESVTAFQPMGANMGLLPKLDVAVKGKQARYAALAERAVRELGVYLMA